MTLMKKLGGYEICDQVARDNSKNAANITKGTLPIARGGTGATSAAGILTNMGISATATELNRCDGVTSAIQTQLNGKAASSHNHSAANITSGVLPNYRGGTGITNQSDAIVASGTSGNFNYIKYNNGFAYLVFKIDFTNVSVKDDYGSCYYTQTGTYNFPFNFIGTPKGVGSNNNGQNLTFIYPVAINSRNFSMYICASYATIIGSVSPCIMFAGRWR